MATTKRTIDEAQEYIDESIAHWIKIGEEKKILSLAGMAEKWSSKTVNHKHKMSQLRKNIRALELIMERNLRLDQDADNSVLEKAFELEKTAYDKLVAEHGEPKAKKPKQSS